MANVVFMPGDICECAGDNCRILSIIASEDGELIFELQRIRDNYIFLSDPSLCERIRGYRYE